MAPLQKRGKIVTLHSVNELLNLYNPRPPSVIPSVARNLPFSCRHPRDLIAPLPGACGRGCAAVPKSSWGRGLFERSEFRSPHSRDWGKGTRRVTPGRQWFWVLLPKQKDLVARGRNPASFPSSRGDETPRAFLLLSSSTLVPDVCNRGSKSRIQSLSLCLRSRAIPGQSQGHASWRHLLAPAGEAAPQSRNPVGGEDCLSEASSAALTVGTGAKAPEGPRLGANGFGSFCRNKRTSACGAETPQDPLPLSSPT